MPDSQVQSYSNMKAALVDMNTALAATKTALDTGKTTLDAIYDKLHGTANSTGIKSLVESTKNKIDPNATASNE